MGYKARTTLVFETDEEKELYEKICRIGQSWSKDNPYASLRITTAQEIAAFFNQNIKDVVLHFTPLLQSRWYIHGNQKKQDPHRTLETCVTDVIFDHLNAINHGMDGQADEIAVKAGRNGIRIKGPVGSIFITVSSEPCEVPKKISTSRTDGLRLTDFSITPDIPLCTFFGDKCTDRMKQNYLTHLYMEKLKEQMPCRNDTRSECSNKANRMADVLQKYKWELYQLKQYQLYEGE